MTLPKKRNLHLAVRKLTENRKAWIIACKSMYIHQTLPPHEKKTKKQNKENPKQLNERHNNHYLHILLLLASPIMLRFVLSGKNIID